MVICGQCSNQYASDTTYKNHSCSVTGVKPTEPESMGENWNTIQTEAITRGTKDSEKKSKALKDIDDRMKLKKSKLKEERLSKK